MALSAPLWWWFEFVNEWVRNWQYHGSDIYSDFEYQVFATLAFTTVVPALDAAWRLALRFTGQDRGLDSGTRRANMLEIAVGLAAQAAVFTWPGHAYALVWVAPFLLFDGIAGLMGGINLLQSMRSGRWSLPLAIALAGVGTGFLWELWNYWAWPRWTYSVPFVDTAHLFEMPLPGYGGYVPFAWSVYQVTVVAALLVERFRRESS